MFEFTPDDKTQAALDVPYFEDARADYAPYYSSKKTLNEAEGEVRQEMGKLGAWVKSFTPGTFESAGVRRYGYMINFIYSGAEGRIMVAGLPMRNASPPKIEKVKIQALLNVAAWLKSAVTMQVFSPQSLPLIPYLLNDSGQTLQEALVSGSLALPRGDVEQGTQWELVEGK